MTEYEEQVFEFLDELRESGVTNMYGAGPYIREEFGATRDESHALLGDWMRTFGDRHPREEQPDA